MIDIIFYILLRNRFIDFDEYSELGEEVLSYIRVTYGQSVGILLFHNPAPRK